MSTVCPAFDPATLRTPAAGTPAWITQPNPLHDPDRLAALDDHQLLELLAARLPAHPGNPAWRQVLDHVQGGVWGCELGLRTGMTPAFQVFTYIRDSLGDQQNRQ